MASPSPVGIWGPTRSGKTTYLASLYLTLEQRNHPMRMAFARSDVNAQRFITENREALSRGYFPKPTLNDEPIRMTFGFQRKDDGLGFKGRFHTVSLMDVAGARIFDQPGADFGYFDLLAASKGIVCLVDPEARKLLPDGTYQSTWNWTDLFSRLFEKLPTDRSGKVIPYVAVCITKMDLDEHWVNRNAIEPYLERVITPPAVRVLHNWCDPKRLKIYGISVAGRRRIGDTDRPNVTRITADRLILESLNDWHPYQILNPLFWMFDMIEYEHDRKKMFPLPQLRRWLREPNLKSV